MKPITLLTWLDVEFLLDTRRADRDWPTWLARYTVYQDALEIEAEPGTPRHAVEQFLASAFGQRYSDGRILLVSEPDAQRSLEVYIGQSEEMRRSHELGRDTAPSFRRIAALPENAPQLTLPEPSAPDDPTVVAFYSFKGGVGRTTHLLAYLRALSLAKERRSALVIDADLEAPGITSLMAHEKIAPVVDFSFIDLLALMQSDPDPSAKISLDLATHLTKRQILEAFSPEGQVENYVIPAFRSEEQSMRLDIRPEHVTAGPGRAWSLTTFLLELGRNLGVDVVLVDLRAGYSELSSPFLFDPRVKKVVVTTPSNQSVDGTISVLRQLGKISKTIVGFTHGAESYPADPTVILSFVIAELANSEFMRDVTLRLQQGYPEIQTDETLPNLEIISTPFSQELLYLDSLTEGLERLGANPLTRRMSELIDFDLPPKEMANPAGGASLDAIRNNLRANAEALEYAESGKGESFLRIAPLRALARQFSETPPVAVVIGAKGAGKTYTYLQILRAGNWSKFVCDVTGSEGKAAALWPILYSRNLTALAQQHVEAAQSSAAATLGIVTRPSLLELNDRVNVALRHPLADETWWRHTWFGIFAASMGYNDFPFNGGAGVIIDRLRRTRQQLVLMIDGLEDLLPGLANNTNEQVALRALIQGVPAYLKSVPDNPLGILIFVRADLARAAVPQNYGQFSRLYETFALQWSEEEALRLAVWMADSANVMRPANLATNPPEVLTSDEAKEILLALWGRKLGTEKSREARSAEWVIAALSDFKGQIQARDLVRFLQFAASGSVGSQTLDRVLSPGAIRGAIKPCSEKKIEEAEQEIPQLKAIFSKLQNVTDLRIPFDAADANLTSEDIRFLQSVGVVAELNGEYYMPEIFRFGLNLRLAEGARPKVLSFARRLA